MKKIINFVLFLGLIGVISCQPKDPNELLTSERAIISYFIDGIQIGPAEINRTPSESDFTIYVIDGMDLTSVTPQIEISLGATIFPASGEAVDLSSGEYTYKVTSATGEVRDWVLTVQSFDNKIQGKWKVGKPMEFHYFIGEGESWGWEGVKDLEWTLPGAGAATDNELEFMTVGVDEVGNLYGTGSYTSGADGTFETFVLENACQGSDIDYAPYYGRMPQGDFEWVLDLTNNTIILTQEEKTETTLPIEWINTEDYSVFELAFSPEANDLGWQDCNYNELELNFGKRVWYTIIRDGASIPDEGGEEETDPVIPEYAPISLNGDWGIEDIGFWPGGNAGVCDDFDNIMRFSNEVFDTETGILSGDFEYLAGADGNLTNGNGTDWVVFPESGRFELKLLQNPNDTESREFWTIKFIATDGTELEVPNAVEGGGADQITLKFNGGNAGGVDQEAHWYKFVRNFVGTKPCDGETPVDPEEPDPNGIFPEGTWRARDGIMINNYYWYSDSDNGHQRYGDSQAADNDVITFTSVEQNGDVYTGNIRVDYGDDGTFDLGEYTMKSGTFTYTITGDEYGAPVGNLVINATDGSTITYFKTNLWNSKGDFDFQIKFNIDEVGEVYYRMTDK
ncbi:hypothetical protein KMW28_17185 [Flammeovirga yaeyamensis]|uniref:Lipoprotein n=1 Tax=Flammeovirga yaeyamensis TaxID=367791 RepID=A0AAX1N1E3_9BACT|nr:hypothetical protein [Flammeovirga yaeyamensis]MBB3698247.1 hypothetical protein [Flammeovirga yaeyamensis]NMF34398.1 hypothetical protein [Flammeovirga yaeyamensis]QWG01379.1 hypothetical protein KMW28_17185 [Flammeovirga yaeyamensis]